MALGENPGQEEGAQRPGGRASGSPGPVHSPWTRGEGVPQQPDREMHGLSLRVPDGERDRRGLQRIVRRDECRTKQRPGSATRWARSLIILLKF